MLRRIIRQSMLGATCASLAVALPGAALGAQTGTLTLAGQLQLSTTGALNAPIRIDFGTGTPAVFSFGVPGTVAATGATGIFASLLGTNGTIEDLSADPSGSAAVRTEPVGGLEQFIRIGAFMFAYGPLVPAAGGTVNAGVLRFTDRSAGGSELRIVMRPRISGGACAPSCEGEGTLTATFPNTVGALISDVLLGNQVAPVAFEATFSTAVVPEPTTVGLLAAGLVVLGTATWRRAGRR